jgi:YHS domain-containing protein
MTMLRALLPMLMVIAILLILFVFFKAMSPAKGKRAFNRPKFDKVRKEIDMGELHRDPVSGTYVSEKDAYVETISGKKYYFVSKDNAARFRRGERAEDSE